MDRIRQIEVFVQVVVSGNFTKAAEALSMPRSTISTVIQSLEDRLGVLLFKRTTRHIMLTYEGKKYLTHAQLVLNEFNTTETLFQSEKQPVQGILSIDMPSRIARKIIIPALPNFMQQYPLLKIECHMSDKMTDLMSADVDCVIRVGTSPDQELIRKKIGDIEIINCASPEYLKIHGVPHVIEDLAHHYMVNYAIQLPSVAEWEYVENQEVKKINMSSRMTVDNAEAYIAAAKAGIGMIQIPKFDVKDALLKGVLCEVMHEIKPSPMVLAFMYTHRKNMPQRIQVFKTWIETLLVESDICMKTGRA